jgi:hypothetical protein
MPYLTRVQAAQFLNAQGYPITRKYFAKLCVPSNGQGPPVNKWFGQRALYTPEDLLAWAESRCKPGDDRAAA